MLNTENAEVGGNGNENGVYMQRSSVGCVYIYAYIYTCIYI